MPFEQLGRYEIIGELGRGAMGVVYKARDPLIDRTVAIKAIGLQLTSAETEEFEKRFYREARSAGRLNHSNIVTIHDVGKTDDVAYIAMEFLRGQSLREILDSGVVLPPEKIADIAVQVADGLAYAHANRIVHRDIKPPNIMVLESGLVKITDFGIALLPSGSRTLDGAVFGSPKYMSPEQVTGRAVDGRADIYSLGAVLYEMLTGLPPFVGSDLGAVLSALIHEAPVAPSSRNRSIAPAFDAIVMKAMAKDPADRYGSALEMASELRNLAAAPTVRIVPFQSVASTRMAHRPSSRRVAASDYTVRRHRWNVVIYGASAALLAALVGWRVLSNLAPDGPPAPAYQGQDIASGETPGVAKQGSSKLPREDHLAVESVATRQATPPDPVPSFNEQDATVVKPMARLRLAVVPWGEVYVDGKKKGIAPPLAETKLAPGKHAIEIRNTTFEPYARTIELKADASMKIKHKFH